MRNMLHTHKIPNKPFVLKSGLLQHLHFTTLVVSNINSHCSCICANFPTATIIYFCQPPMDAEDISLGNGLLFLFSPRFRVFRHLYFHLALWGHSNGNLRVNPNLLPTRWQGKKRKLWEVGEAARKSKCCRALLQWEKEREKKQRF